jgi:hypothetical protein
MLHPASLSPSSLCVVGRDLANNSHMKDLGWRKFIRGLFSAYKLVFLMSIVKKGNFMLTAGYFFATFIVNT